MECLLITGDRTSTKETGNIYMEMSLKEIGCEYVDWIPQAQNSVQWRVLLNTIMSLRFP